MPSGTELTAPVCSGPHTGRDPPANLLSSGYRIPFRLHGWHHCEIALMNRS